MKVRFLADNDLRKAVLRGVVRREPDIDCCSAQNARLDGLSDMQVLFQAAQEGRVLVSHDYITMPKHFREFCRSPYRPGVLLIAQDLPVKQAVDCLVLIWEVSQPADWKDRVCMIPSLVTIALAARS